MRYLATTRTTGDQASFVTDTLRDDRKLKACSQEDAIYIKDRLNDGWISWEEAEVLAKQSCSHKGTELELIARLTETVELLTSNLNLVIAELKRANDRIEKLEYVAKGPADGIKAKTIDRILEEIKKGGRIV